MTTEYPPKEMGVIPVTRPSKVHESEGQFDRFLVEGTFRGDARLRNGKPLPNRVSVENSPHWQISKDGKVYYQRREVKPRGTPPVIDLGPSAYPPVFPAYGDGSRERFLDELVCWHFHGPISPTLQLFTHIRRLDGDWNNCAADNLVRELDEEWRQANNARRIAEWMMAKTWGSGIRDCGGEFDYVPGVATLPTWAPLSPEWVPTKTIDKGETE